MSKSKENNDRIKEERKDEDTVMVPDGGWGWVVCFAVFWLNFCVAGCGTSNGIVLLGLVDLYDESVSKAAMVGSLFIGSLMCAGPLVLILMTFEASHRQVIMSGGLIAFFSTILSVFAPRLQILYFTYGILTGGSVGMAYFAANTILASYFKKKRSLVVGIAFSGGGCEIKESSFKQTETNLAFELEQPAANICSVHAGSNGIVEDIKTIQEKHRPVLTKRISTKCRTILSTLFDPVIFKNHGLQILLVIYFIWSAGEVLPIFLPANVVNVGLSRQEGALVMSIYGVTFAFGQLVVGMIADFLHVPISYILTFSMLVLTVTSLAIPFCRTFIAFAACTTIFAVFHGFTTALRVVLAASILGVKNLAKSYSPVCLSIGVGYILFPLITGVLFDATQSFGVIFYFVGCNLFFGLIASIGIIYMQVKGKFEE